MRRTKLVWFLAGVIVATFVNLAAKWFIAPSVDNTKSQYFVVSDRKEFPEGVRLPNRQIVEANPEILRACGIRNFVIWQADGIPDGLGVTSGFQPSKQSDESVTCVLVALEDAKLFGQVKSAALPNDLAPEVIQSRKQEAALKNAQTH